MTNHRWAALIAFAVLAAASSATAQDATPMDHFLCDKFKSLEQAAQHGFLATVGRERKLLGPLSVGPKTFEAALALPEAEDCFVRPTGRALANSYYCFWRSSDPDQAALSYIRRISQCFMDAKIAQSDFNSDFVVTTDSGVAFFVGSTKKGDKYEVRLLVNSLAR